MESKNSKFHRTFPSFLRWVEMYGKLPENDSLEPFPVDPNDVFIEGFLDFNSIQDRDHFILSVQPNWVNPLFSQLNSQSDDKHTQNTSQFDNTSVVDSKPAFNFIGAFKYTPLLWVHASFQWFQIIESNSLVKSIYYNLPLYLCLNQINQMFNTSIIANSFFEFEGKDIKVGLIDSGIDQTHPDLQNRVIDIINITSEDSGDTIGHGTMLAGIIAGNGKASNNIFHGIAPKTDLIDIKVFNQDGSARIADVLLALDLILDRSPEKQPNIILFGGTTAVPWSEDDLLSRYCSILIEKNIFIVCPSGNFGPDPGFIPSPAGHPSVLCVGAVDFENKSTFFTGRRIKSELHEEISIDNIKPNVFLPGTEVVCPSIISSYIGIPIPNASNYIVATGTSISAAVATGLLVILREAFPTKSIHEIMEFFQQTEFQQFDLVSILQKANLFFPKPLSYKKLIQMSGFLAILIFGISIGLYFLLNYLK